MHNTLKPNGNIPTEFNYIFSSQGPCCVTCEKSTTQQMKHKVKIEKYFIKKDSTELWSAFDIGKITLND